MHLARIENGEVVQYPYPENEFRAAWPNTSFRADLTGMDLSEFGAIIVSENPPPTGLQPGQVAEEAMPEPNVEGTWTQNWAVRNGTAEELVAAKRAKWTQVKTMREQVISAGCTVPGIGTFQTDPVSMDNIHQSVTGALLAQLEARPFTVSFTLADNSSAVLSGAQMMLAAELAGGRKAACHVRSQQLRGAIEATTTFAALASIDIETGWPE